MSDKKLDLILDKIQVMGNEVQEIKSEIRGMKSEIQGMKSEIQGINSELQEVKRDVKILQETSATKKDMEEFPAVKSVIYDIGNTLTEVDSRMKNMELSLDTMQNKTINNDTNIKVLNERLFIAESKIQKLIEQ